MDAPEQALTYEIRVLGVLDARWSAWFAGLDVSCSGAGETTLTGPIRDQAELHGVLARVRDLGLPLVALRRLDCPVAPGGDSDERVPLTSDDRIPDVPRRLP